MLDDSITKINNCQEVKTRVKIYPDLIIAGVRDHNKNGGAVRLWTLARHFNQPGGSSFIPSKALRRHIISDLSIKRGVYDVWLSRALAIGLLERRGKLIKITGLTEAAIILKVDHIKRPEYVYIGKLIKKHWLAWVWAEWLESMKFIDRPISRGTLRYISGIPERCQGDYEKLAGVINHANYAKHEGAASKEAIYDLLMQGRPVFDNNGQTLERLPNSREIREKNTAPEGRTRRANSQLKDLLIHGGQDPKKTIGRVYCQGDEQTEETLRVIAKRKNRGVLDFRRWIYQASEKERFWYAIPA